MSIFNQEGVATPVAARLPDYSLVSRLLARVSPQGSLNTLKRAFNKAFSTNQWHVKATDLTWYSATIGVVDSGGSTITEDAASWIKQQSLLIGCNNLADRLRQEDLRLERSEGGEIYALGLNSNDPLDFVQIRIRTKSQAVYSLRNIEPWFLTHAPDGYPYCWDTAAHSTPVYSCEPTDIIGSLDWLDQCNASHRDKLKDELTRLKKLSVTRTYSDGRKEVGIPFLTAHPLPLGWSTHPSREQRWFSDWNRSSAGSHPMGRFWYLETSDFIDEGLHNVGFIPQAVIWPKKRIRTRDKSRLELIDRLARFDRAVNCPFGWYFFMVHGNRITCEVGKRIAEDIRKGEIHIAPNDEAVLMAWADDPYSF